MSSPLLVASKSRSYRRAAQARCQRFCSEPRHDAANGARRPFAAEHAGSQPAGRRWLQRDCRARV